jgi:hypothetical protein
MKDASTRLKDFKIGCFHGKINPEDGSIEAKLRNELYLIGMLKIAVTRSESIDIRLVAYELPLQTGKLRGRCIDLLGYDQNKVPWIIELKKADSNEKLNQVIEQVLEYADLFRGVRNSIEHEIQKKYHWNEYRFSENTQKMILAHRSFFQNTWPKNHETLGIYCCSFSHTLAENSLLEKFGSKGFVRLKIENR